MTLCNRPSWRLQSTLLLGSLLLAVVGRAEGPSGRPASHQLASGSDASSALRNIGEQRASLVRRGSKSDYKPWGTIQTASKDRKTNVAESWEHFDKGSVLSTSMGMARPRNGIVSIDAWVDFDLHGRPIATTTVRSEPPKDGVQTHHVVIERREEGAEPTVAQGIVHSGARIDHSIATVRGTSAIAVDLPMKRMPETGRGLAWILARSLHGDSKARLSSDKIPSSVADIALGRDRNEGRASLEQFGTAVGASMYRAWQVRGMATRGSPVTQAFDAERFLDGLQTAVARGGRVRFDLTDVDVARARALPADSPMPEAGITEWELSQVLAKPEYRRAAVFYKQTGVGAYRELAPAELDELGIAPASK